MSEGRIRNLPWVSMPASCSTSLPIRLASTNSGHRLVMRIRNRAQNAAETWVNMLADRKFLRYWH